MRFKNALRYRGLFVIALWQAAPVGIDEYGRTRLGFGLGRGTVEFANFGCDGSLIDAQTVGYSTAAVEAEHWIEPGRWRVHGSAGYQWSDSLSLRGPLGALLVGYDRPKFGIGGGVALIPETQYQSTSSGEYQGVAGAITVPSFYLRGGSRDRVHVRIEVFTPTVTTPTVRLLLGYNQFNSRKTSFALGVAAVGFEGGTGGFMADLFHPVAPNFEVGASAYVASGHRDPQSGVTLRGRLTL